MTVTRSRGRSVRVPVEWLEQVRRWKDGRNIAQLRVELGQAMGRERPVSRTRLHAYLSGESATREMTEAFARLMGVPPPVITAPLDDPDIARWCDLGKRLKAEHRRVSSASWRR